MTEKECKLDINPRWAGFQIPYFTLDGKVDPEMYRYRYLQYQPSSGFGALTVPPEKPRRYTQPAGTTCGVYLPPLLPKGVNWRAVAEDAEAPLLITEGELKAACGTLHGMYTIGLGGVYNWKSRKQGYSLLPILEQFNWEERKVYVCFDSDMETNPMVCAAASQLSWTLTQRGAKVLTAHLPAMESGAKQGMDDYILANGFPKFATEIIQNAVMEKNSEALHELNTEVAYCTASNEIVVVDSGQVMKHADFVNAAYKHRVYEVFHMQKDGTKGPGVLKYAAKEWLAWPRRATVKRLCYEPGGPLLLPEDGSYNTWPGWAVEPRAGSVEPWERLLDSLMANARPEHVLWLRRWFAYPLRYPGAKLATAVLVWGAKQGTGKTLLGDTMRYLYGRNYANIGNAELASGFNEWAVDKQFIVGDEVSLGNKRATSDNLKAMITRQQLTVNRKYRAEYVIRDCINYYFTSNHPDALFLEDHDRRFFVHEVEQDPKPNGFYTEYVKWLEKDGAAALMDYFVNKLDMGDFRPNYLAPVTSSKIDMIISGKSDIADWCQRLRADPASVLQIGGVPSPYCLWTNEDLLSAYDVNKSGKVTANGLAREMTKAGFQRAARGNNTIRVEEVRVRLWAVQGPVEKLARMQPVDAQKFYHQERDQFKSKGGGTNGQAGRARKM